MVQSIEWTPEVAADAPAMLRYKMRGDACLKARQFREAEIAYDTGLQTFDDSISEVRVKVFGFGNPSADPSQGDIEQWLHGMKIMLILGRGRASLNSEPQSQVPFKRILADAMTVNRMEPNGVEGLELFAVCMTSLASAPRQLADKGQEAAQRSFMHAMAADVWAMLIEDAIAPREENADATQAAKWGAWRSKSAPKLAQHRANAHKLLYEERRLAWLMLEDARALSDPDDPMYLMASYLIALTYYRMGCRSPPLAWRPYHVARALRRDRVMEVIMLHRIKSGTDREGIQAWVQTLEAGKQVRLSGLERRADLNGRTGNVLSLPDAESNHRYGVAVDRVPAGVLGEEELPPESVRLKVDNLLPVDAF